MASFPIVNELEAGRLRLGFTRYQLWLAYFAMGGNGTLVDVGGWLEDAPVAPARDHDLLAQALNDGFLERGQDHPIPYTVE